MHRKVYRKSTKILKERYFRFCPPFLHKYELRKVTRCVSTSQKTLTGSFFELPKNSFVIGEKAYSTQIFRPPVPASGGEKTTDFIALQKDLGNPETLFVSHYHFCRSEDQVSLRISNIMDAKTTRPCAKVICGKKIEKTFSLLFLGCKTNRIIVKKHPKKRECNISTLMQKLIKLLKFFFKQK